MSEDAVAALAVGSGRDAAELFDATGGNPLFVTELIAAPPGRLPSSIKDAVVARLGQLPATDAEVVRAISIVPDRVERTAIEVLCGPSDDSLAVAEHRGLLAGDASHIWFRHELVRQAVEDTLASSERVRLHRQMARYLFDRHDDPARVVHHATHCGDIELLLTAGPAAAHQASAAGAHRQAVQHIEAVLRYADRASDRAPRRPADPPDPLALPAEPLRRLAGEREGGGGDVRPAGRSGPDGPLPHRLRPHLAVGARSRVRP